jgi:hypothetical protein
MDTRPNHGLMRLSVVLFSLGFLAFGFCYLIWFLGLDFWPHCFGLVGFGLAVLV